MTADEAARAAIYVRISQDREGSHLGVDRQRAECADLAERLGWSVVTVHTDNDVTAYSGRRRPGYEALLADMRAGHVLGVLAWHTPTDSTAHRVSWRPTSTRLRSTGSRRTR